MKTKSAQSAKSAVKNLKPLWKCPKCGERFTGRNMWHSCGKFTLEELFARSEPKVRKIFRKFAKMARTCGPVIPQKARIVFQVRMRFAGVTPRKIDHRRFEKVETFNPRCHVHYLRISSEDELDDDVARWIKQAYEVGQQKFSKCS